MPSSEDYIPAEDAPFVLWAAAFIGAIAASPAVYMMTGAQAAYLQGLLIDFQAKLAITSSESTRTKPAIIARNNSRHMLETLCRQYAMQIKDNLGISDEDKVSAGVRPINPVREPRELSGSWPVLNVLGNTPGGGQTLRYIDSVTEDRAKPFAATELQLFVAVTTTETAPLSEAKFYGKFTRNPVPVVFDETQDGKFATYYARWASAKGETGPWSMPVTMRIAA